MKIHPGNFVPLTLTMATLVANLIFATQTRAGSFVETTDMNATRSDFTSTLLPNGKVLVAGGLDASGFLASAELFDPATATWTSTGALTVTRDGHTATLLPNGKVLVVGGQAASDLPGEPSADTELYDPVSGKWMATGSLRMPRRWHTATLLPNGKVLVVGGYNGVNGFLSSAELYDPATGKWSLTGNMLTARRAHTATLLPDGRVLVVGGLTRIGNLSNAELYDPATGRWIPTGAMSVARKYHTATLLPGGKVLVAGGQGVINNTLGSLASAELYDPVTETWTATGALATARYGHTATLLANGHVLVVGGIGSDGILANTELFDPATGKWTTMGALNTARVLHTAALLPDGRVLIAGGNDNNSSRNLSSAELFDPAR